MHPISLGELVESWLADITPDLSADTLKEFRRILEANVRPALGEVGLVKEPDRIWQCVPGAEHERFGAGHGASARHPALCVAGPRR